jgi:hypothetical protein
MKFADGDIFATIKMGTARSITVHGSGISPGTVARRSQTDRRVIAIIVVRPGRCGNNSRVSGVPVFQLTIGRGLGASQVRAICDAFDGAWAALTEVGSPFVQPDKAPAAREVLAKRIIDMAETGMSDAAPLREDALAYLRLHPPVD